MWYFYNQEDILSWNILGKIELNGFEICRFWDCSQGTHEECYVVY